MALTFEKSNLRSAAGEIDAWGESDPPHGAFERRVEAELFHEQHRRIHVHSHVDSDDGNYPEEEHGDCLVA